MLARFRPDKRLCSQPQPAPDALRRRAARPANRPCRIGRCTAWVQYILDHRRRRSDLDARPDAARQGPGVELGRQLPRHSDESRGSGKASAFTISSFRCSFSSPASRSCWHCRGWSSVKGRVRAHLHVLRRALLLYVLGLIFYGGFSQHWSDIRFVGVLQRIAICYLFASILFLNLDWRGLIVALVALLCGYWALMTFVPVPGIGAGSFAPDANLADWIDAHYLPGRLWDKTRDPEGLLSTLPAIGTCVLGVLAGLLLKDERLTPTQKSLWLIGAGVVMMLPAICGACNSQSSRRSGRRHSCWSPAATVRSCSASCIRSSMSGDGRLGLRFSFGSAPMPLRFTSSTALPAFEPFALRFVGGDVSAWLDRCSHAGNRSFRRPCAGTCVRHRARWLPVSPKDIPARLKRQVPTFNSDTSARSAATVEGATLLPVRGFSDGIFSMVIVKRAVSASTVIV